MIRSQENQELESLCDFFTDADKWTGLGSINSSQVILSS